MNTSKSYLKPILSVSCHEMANSTNITTSIAKVTTSIAKAVPYKHVDPVRGPGLNLNDPNEAWLAGIIIVVCICCGAPCLYFCVALFLNGIGAGPPPGPGRYHLAHKEPKIIHEYV